MLVKVVPVVTQSFRPAIMAYGRVHSPDHTVLEAPYDALMGPLLVAPGSHVKAGAVIVRLLPLQLAGTVRALNARVLAAKTASQQGQILARQGLITPAHARALRAAWQTDVEARLAATARLARGTVRAPFAGNVHYRAAPGAWLNRGAVVAKMAGRGGLYETADLTLSQAAQVYVGARAAIGTPSQTDKGRVYAVATRVDGLGLVRAYIHDLHANLRPGQVIRLTLLGHQRTALAVPRTALVVRHARPWVFVVEAGHAHPVAVAILHLGVHTAFVAARALHGASVIDTKVARLRPGTTVQVAP